MCIRDSGEGLDSSAENSGDDVNGENEKKDGTNQEETKEPGAAILTNGTSVSSYMAVSYTHL